MRPPAGDDAACAGGGVGARGRAMPSVEAAAPRSLALPLLAALAVLGLIAPAEGVDGARPSKSSLRQMEVRLEGKVSLDHVGRDEAVAGGRIMRQREERKDGVNASDWWPREGDCSAMLDSLTSVHARGNYLSASGEGRGDSEARAETDEGIVPVVREPRHFECGAHRGGALLSGEVGGWPSAARDKATGAAAVRAADSASGANGAWSGGAGAHPANEAKRPLIYWMHERKAGGDLVKGCIGVPSESGAHSFGIRGVKYVGVRGRRFDYCNRSQSLLANTSALTLVTEFFAAPVMCMHDEAVAHRSTFVAVVRHPLFRWQSEMSWSKSIAYLDNLWQLFAHNPPPLGGQCPPGDKCTGMGGISRYIQPVNGKLSPRPRERVSDEELEAAVRDLRSWMNNTWDQNEGCEQMRDRDMTAAGQQQRGLGRAGTMKPQCYIDNYLVRLLSQNCSCNMEEVADGKPSGHFLLHNPGDFGCGIDYHRRVTYEDFLLAKQAAASFNALIPLERLKCDAERVFALLGGNAGASMHPDFRLDSGSHESSIEFRILEVPELRAMLEADNMYDLVSSRTAPFAVRP